MRTTSVQDKGALGQTHVCSWRLGMEEIKDKYLTKSDTGFSAEVDKLAGFIKYRY